MTIAKIKQLRSTTLRLQAEYASVEAAPPARSETRDAALAQLNTLSDQGREQMLVGLRKMAAGSERAGALFGARVAPVYGADHASLGPVLAALLGPQALVDAIAPLLQALPEGMTRADRAARLDAIKADLFSAELAEETVDRRG